MRSLVLRLSIVLSVLAVTVALSPAAQAKPARAIYHDPNPAQVARYIAAQAKTPYQGWSSWSLQATHAADVNPQGDYSWLTADHVLQQGKVLARTLKKHGYNYVNIDAGWWRKWDWTPEYDQYGRPAIDTARFPNGIASVARTLHAEGLKVGIYMPVGLEKGAYDNGDFPIYGAPGCSTHDIVYSDLRTTNGWDSSYKIDFSTPCAQYYYDSIAREFAQWGIDFLKVDGVGPGSNKTGANYDNTSDVQAWATALAGSGRNIHLELSWSLSHDAVSSWQTWSNGWRIDTDVECYCDTLVTWDHSVKARFKDAPTWAADAGRGGWNDFDSLDVGAGSLDGLTDAERQSYMTLWAASAAPLYTGDDLTKLDAYGLSLLTNDEVIAIDQAGVPIRPQSTATNQQVWSARLKDGSTVVALFNLDTSAASVTADLRSLAINGTVRARDVWAHSTATVRGATITRTLPAHGSALYRITPKR